MIIRVDVAPAIIILAPNALIHAINRVGNSVLRFHESRSERQDDGRRQLGCAIPTSLCGGPLSVLDFVRVEATHLRPTVKSPLIVTFELGRDPET